MGSAKLNKNKTNLMPYIINNIKLYIFDLETI